MVDQVRTTPEAVPTIARWDHKIFVQKLKDAGASRLPTMESLPASIDLEGMIGDICDQLMRMTLQDPRKREHARYAVVTPDQKLLVRPGVFIGNEDSATFPIELTRENAYIHPKYEKSEQYVLCIHTHGDKDIPPSPVDFSRLISNYDNFGEAASIIETFRTRFLILRTLDTSELSKQEVEQFIQEGTSKIRQDAMIAGRNGLLEQIKGQLLGNMAFVMETCQKHHLGLYTSLVSPNDPHSAQHFVRVKC